MAATYQGFGFILNTHQGIYSKPGSALGIWSFSNPFGMHKMLGRRQKDYRGGWVETEDFLGPKPLICEPGTPEGNM